MSVRTNKTLAGSTTASNRTLQLRVASSIALLLSIWFPKNLLAHIGRVFAPAKNDSRFLACALPPPLPSERGSEVVTHHSLMKILLL